MPNLDAASARVLNNAKAFRAAGCNVSFISWGGQYMKSDLCDDGKYRTFGFQYTITGELDCEGGFFSKLRHRICRGNKTKRLLENMTEKPDAIVLYNAEYSWTKKMMSYCKKNHVRLIHDMTEWFSNNEIHLTDIIPNYLNMTRLQKKVPNKILISEYLNSRYPESHNIVLPPLCDKTDNKWNEEINDERLDGFVGTTLIYAGSPMKKDCLHVVINVVNQLLQEGAKLRLIILGVNKEKYVEDYKKWIHSPRIHDNIIFLGRVSQEFVPAYYKKADFMVLIRKPSRKNQAGFPTKVAESMVSGTPVITNATSDLSKYVIDGKTGFLVYGYNEVALSSVLKS